MKRPLSLLLAILICTLLSSAVRADELSEVQKKLSQKNSEYASAQASLDKIKKDLAVLGNSLAGTQSQLDAANAKVADAKAQLAAVEKTISQKEDTLNFLLDVRNKQIRQIYATPQPSGFEVLFSAGSFSSLVDREVYSNQIVLDSKELISLVNEELTSFKRTQEEINKTKTDLEAVAAQIATQLAAVRSSYSAASSQRNNLNNKVKQISTSLADLNAQQRELLAAKYGITSSPIGATPPTGDPRAEKGFDPGFRPAFAAFSFGAYTHRNGMSQYGARGRAVSGQSAEQILAAYYPGTSLNKNYPVPATIVVNGTNEYGQTFNNVTYAYQDYLKHLYEVPAHWPMEVLKAQAVAARSYAIRRGSPICPSQSCQVVKHEVNATAWQQAVDATNGWVLTGGSGSFQYSSTSGGYLNTSGWDTNCGNMGCWLSGGAWESIGGSPWFYKGWYKDLSGASCGRSHPWLTQTEFADMLNAWVVYTRGNSGDKARVLSIDVNSCFGSGGSPYSIDEMRNRAEQLGGAYTTVSTASSVYDPGGFTSVVKFVTNRGYLEISGPQFKDILNLRLPGKLAIKTPLYNIESKF